MFKVTRIKIYTTLHIKLKIEQHESHYKLGVKLGATKRLTVPAPLVTPVVICYMTRISSNMKNVLDIRK